MNMMKPSNPAERGGSSCRGRSPSSDRSKKQKEKKFGLDQLKFVKVLGKGSFGKVDGCNSFTHLNTAAVLILSLV